MKRAWILISGCLPMILAPLCGQAQPTPPVPVAAIPGAPHQACSLPALTGLPGIPGGEITSVRWMAAPVPYCRVDGVVHTSNPGPNTVGFMIALPQSWNGRYLMVIPGGSAGYIVDPSEEHLRAGYAVATTDKGSHSPGALNMAFRSDPGRSEDFAWRGTHVATAETQQIALAYYGRTRAPRYIMGCSGGGVSTLLEAERFPADADGFVAGAPPTDAYVQTMWAAIAQYVARDPARWISPADMARVGRAIMDRFDDSDGARDGLIQDPTKIVLTRALFPFLTDAQYGTLQALQAGLPAIRGSTVSAPGYWLANPSLLGPIVLGSAPPPWTAQTRPALYGSTVYSMQALRGPGYDAVKQMDFSDPRQREAEKAIWDKVGGYDLGPEHLDALHKQGARLILWAGASDEAIPPAYTARFSSRVDAALSDQFRGFLIPGMFHCRGGERQPTDASSGLLKAMERWVEGGEAPGQVVLTNDPRPIEVNSTSNTAQYVSGMSDKAETIAADRPRSYLVCALPRHAMFTGDATKPGAIDDARNWHCGPPA
jgi:hypothetical protein